MDPEQQPLLRDKYSANSLHNDAREICDDETSSEATSCFEPYNPSKHRDLEHPTSNVDTMIHLLKGNIGTGILAMPNAFKNAGLYFGLIATLLLGFICTHCMHMLVGAANELCRRHQVPSMNYSEVAYSAFRTGPALAARLARKFKLLIDVFLCVTQLGACSVYFVFVALNLRSTVSHYYRDIDAHIYLLALPVPIILMNFLKNLKYLTPISLIASVLTAAGISITFYYMLLHLPPAASVKSFSSWRQLPLYFGTAIYAFEGIGVILPLENNMATPEHFGGASGVLNTGMAIVVCMYTAVGFFGYEKYGESVLGSITLNLNPDEVLAQTVQVTMALAIFFSYALQFYVPFNIIAPPFRSLFGSESGQAFGDDLLRVILIVFTCIVAMFVPDLDSIISLVGATSSSTLALIFPPLIEIATFWPNNLGRWHWVLWKDVAIMLVGLFGCGFGTYASIDRLINPIVQPVASM